MHKKLQRLNMAGSFVLALSGTGAALSFMAVVPRWVQIVVGLSLAIASVGMFVSALPTKAAVAHTMSVQCSGLALEFKTLFYDYRYGRLESDDALKEWSKLVERLTNVTSKAGVAGMSTDKKLITKSYETASQVISYATAT